MPIFPSPLTTYLGYRDYRIRQFLHSRVVEAALNDQETCEHCSYDNASALNVKKNARVYQAQILYIIFERLKAPNSIIRRRKKMFCTWRFRPITPLSYYQGYY